VCVQLAPASENRMGGGEMLAAEGRPNVIAGDRMKPGASQHAVKKLGREHARSGPPQGPGKVALYLQKVHYERGLGDDQL
jgi:hypothetical protein